MSIESAMETLETGQIRVRDKGIYLNIIILL